MVNLTRIYTKTGDDGTTALGDFSRTSKTDPRLAAYADVDEANSAIGVAISLGELPDDVVSLLTRVQNDLFDVGADLCTPVVESPKRPALRVDQAYVERLEQACDAHNAGLAPLRSFILPGGARGAALEADGDSMNPLPAKYLNRLSDLLFILARVANAERGDVLWVPGGPAPR
jgi:cob(I)alamin adenosyltransferase